MLLGEYQTGGDASDVEKRRDVARYLTGVLVRASETALADALDGEESNIRAEDDGSLRGIQDPRLISRSRGQLARRRTGMVYLAQSSWSSLMNLRQK